MIFGIDEDGVIRARRHAGFATDADRFIEIDDAIGAFEHRRGGAGNDTGRVRALITTGHLVCATRLWKHTYVYVLNVGARDPDRHDVLGLAGGGARVTADATRVVDDLRPLHGRV
jgi:hypothetical protein